MAHVKGDRIGESQRLNRCSAVAAEFYAAMLAAEVQDDFGRFRDTAQHVWIKMHPRREPTPADLRRVRKLLDELARAGLWLTWTMDGVGWAELYNPTPKGNMYHRTPEPPADLYQGQKAPHRHTQRCASTALARAREWGDSAALEPLLLLLKKIDHRKPDGEPVGKPAEGERDGGRGTPPSVHSVRSVHSKDLHGKSVGGLEAPPADDLSRAQAECTAALLAAVPATGIPADELLPRASRPKGSAAVITRIDTCDRVEWLDATRDRLIGLRLEAEERAPPEQRQQAANETLAFYEQHGWPKELAEKCAAYARINSTALPGRQAIDRWLEIHSAPHHVRIEVLRRTVGLLAKEKRDGEGAGEHAAVRAPGLPAEGGGAAAVVHRAAIEVPGAAKGPAG